MPETFPRGIKVLVIGASGFIGTALWQALARHGADVQCLSRTMPSTQDWTHAPRWHLGQMDDDRTLSTIIPGKEIVFHLAHSSVPAESNRDPIKEVHENVCGSLKILDACVKEGVRKVVFASSGGTVYGVSPELPIREEFSTNPLACYGISKIAIEKHLFLYRHLHNLDYQVLRIGNPYGPNQSPFKTQGLIANIIYRGLTDKSVDVFGDGSIIRDYVFIDDVVRALLASVWYDGREKIMNVGTGEGRTIMDVVRAVERALGSGDLAVNRRHARKVDVPANILDAGLIRREMAWRPLVSFEDGIERTVAWMRSRYPSDG